MVKRSLDGKPLKKVVKRKSKVKLVAKHREKKRGRGMRLGGEGKKTQKLTCERGKGQQILKVGLIRRRVFVWPEEKRTGANGGNNVQKW